MHELSSTIAGYAQARIACDRLWKFRLPHAGTQSRRTPGQVDVSALPRRTEGPQGKPGVRTLPPERVDDAVVRSRDAVKRIVVFALLLASGSRAGAQGVRVTGVTSVQAVDLRPLVDDSVPVGLTTGTGPYRALSDGRLVRCIEGEPFCRFRRSGTRDLVAPLVQDLRAVAWGFGQGISLHAHLRARGSLGGSDPAWPRAEDEFDAIEAFVEIDRGLARGRLGRQWATSGLGVFNYDGASIELRRGRLRVEALGGRSLVAGLNDPIDGSQLGAIDDLPPDEGAWLLGLSASTPVSTLGVMAATWQRVVREDRAALYSDRIAADATLRMFGVSTDLSLTWDVTGQEVNDASLRLVRNIGPRTSASVEGRRHRPFFEAWTIWGAFSPVPFDELRGVIDWRSRSGEVGVDVRAGRRRYGATDAGLESVPLRRDGWRAGAGSEWAPDERWLVYGDYDIDIGFGASRSDVAVGARWMPDENRWIGLTASGLQHIYEFRVGTGRVTGLRLDAGTRITPDMRVLADAALYAHRMPGESASPDWSQRRLSVRIEWTAGRDPGDSAVRSRP